MQYYCSRSIIMMMGTSAVVFLVLSSLVLMGAAEAADLGGIVDNQIQIDDLISSLTLNGDNNDKLVSIFIFYMYCCYIMPDLL